MKAAASLLALALAAHTPFPTSARGGAGTPGGAGGGWFNPSDELQRCITQISNINTACPCTPACSTAHPLPTTCDAGCAEVFNPFYEQCEVVLRGVASMSDQIAALESVYAQCQQVDLGATSGACPLDGTWRTGFDRNLQIRGDEGAYLGEWGGLYDIAWTDNTHVEGTFHNNNADRVGRFVWTFDPSDCSQFTGQWGWELDSSMDGAWNGQYTNGNTPLAPAVLDAGVDAALAANDLFRFNNRRSISGWEETLDGVMGGLSTGVFEYDADHQCGLFHGTIELTQGGFSLVTGPSFTADQKAALSAADGIEVCAQELLPGAPTLFKVGFKAASRWATTYQGDFTASIEGSVQEGSDCEGSVARIPFSELYPTQMGRVNGAQGSMSMANIDQMEFTLSYLTDNGRSNPELDHTIPGVGDNVPFEFCLHWVRPYSGNGGATTPPPPPPPDNSCRYDHDGECDDGSEAGMQQYCALGTDSADCGGGSGATLNLVETLVSMPDTFSTLVAAVTAAGLVPTLSGAGPFTVFAPTNAAFAALGQSTINSLLADPTGQLATILTYHVAAGHVLSTQLHDGMQIPTVEGASITVTIDRRHGVMLNGVARVVTADVECSNGVAHVIDAVLTPPPGNPACWSGSYNFDRCCDTQCQRGGGGCRQPNGDTSCWSGSYDFNFCCGTGAGGH